jgi:hypothetical protein
MAIRASRTYSVRLHAAAFAHGKNLLLTQHLQDAVDALNTLQTPFAVIEARRKAGIRPDASSIAEMRTYLGRIGHTVGLLRSLFTGTSPTAFPFHTDTQQLNDLSQMTLTA